jgi:hypothetical protein
VLTPLSSLWLADSPRAVESGSLDEAFATGGGQGFSAKMLPPMHYYKCRVLYPHQDMTQMRRHTLNLYPGMKLYPDSRAMFSVGTRRQIAM